MRIDTIQKFIFNKAEYLIGDNRGVVLLRIDYYHNDYEIEQRGEIITEELKQEVHEVARDLLKRKHGVNFVDRLTNRAGQSKDLNNTRSGKK